MCDSTRLTAFISVSLNSGHGVQPTRTCTWSLVLSTIVPGPLLVQVAVRQCGKKFIYSGAPPSIDFVLHSSLTSPPWEGVVIDKMIEVDFGSFIGSFFNGV